MINARKTLGAVILGLSLGIAPVSFAEQAAEDIPDPFAQFKNTPKQAQDVQQAFEGGDIPVVIPDPPVFPAQSWVLMDYATGQVIFEHNMHEKIWPASLTKMMTSYVLGMEMKAGRVTPDDDVIITEAAWSKSAKYADSSKMFIEVGKAIKMSDLNRGIIIQSGNDACAAVAIHLAGSEEGFVSVMNAYGKKLGLTGTHFANVHGLFDEQNYSTAYDMAVLSRALIRDLPDEYAIYKEKDFVFNKIKQVNRNKLLWDMELDVDGIKTGHLSQVGYNLAASAYNDQMRLIAVVIGAASENDRANYCKQMLKYGFSFFEHYQPFESDKPILTREVRMGTENHVDLVVRNFGAGVVIPVDSQKDIKITYKLKASRFIAPIEKDEQLGILTYTLKDKVIATFPLVASEGIEEGGFFTRMWDRSAMFFGSSEEAAESSIDMQTPGDAASAGEGQQQPSGEEGKEQAAEQPKEA